MLQTVADGPFCRKDTVSDSLALNGKEVKNIYDDQTER
jgi:hypothetical protein